MLIAVLHYSSCMRHYQNFDVNFGSRSLMIEDGIPYWHIHCSNNIVAIYSASKVDLIGTNFTNLLNRSTMLNIASYPCDSGK